MESTSPVHKVIISILNWNSAELTLKCIRSLLALSVPTNCQIQITVIDNGSEERDYLTLKDGIDPGLVHLHRQPENLGFAGGHNVTINQALKLGVDFIWLMNSDAVVESAALSILLHEMASHPDCGAISPVIVSTDDDLTFDFCGNVHDWVGRGSIRATDLTSAMVLQEKHPADYWVAGTAVLFRVKALSEVGILDSRLFAYYEDDDICARLSKAGWTSRTAFQARARHAVFARHFDRPAHFHYLTNRNHLFFWQKHTPSAFRRLLWLKLIDYQFFEINRLYRRGLIMQGDAGLLGIHDFLVGRMGRPILKRRVPILTRMLQRLMALVQHKALNKSPSDSAS